MALPEHQSQLFHPTPLRQNEKRITASRLVRAGLRTTDITQQLIEAALKIPAGRVVKDEAFTLFEAVSAIEIGDGKMDSGHLEEGESFEDDYNVAQSLSSEQIIWIMDELFYHEVAWHMGYPLSQTLFSSLYINALLWPEPKALDEAQFSSDRRMPSTNPLVHLVFRPFCLALIKACDLVRKAILAQHFYEEEDLTSHIFHRELLHRFDCNAIHEALDNAMSWLESADMFDTHRVAIQHRLESRRHLLILLKRASDPLQLPECRTETCLAFFNEIEKSTSMGSSVAEAFSLKVQRTLASSVPPRPMIRIRSDEAFSFMKQLLLDLSHVHELLTLDHSGRLLPGYWIFMSRSSSYSAYIRAITQSIVGQEKLPGNNTLREFILKDLRRLVLPGSKVLDPASDKVELPSDERFQIARQLDDFVQKCGQSYLNIYRTYCLNRCRIRRTLCHAILEWDQLQADAEECDASIQLLTGETSRVYRPDDSPTFSYPLSSWIYHHKLHQMELTVLMGFELSIYAPDEIPKLYWQLSQILSVHVSHLDRMSHFADQESDSRIILGNENASLAEAEKTVCLQELFREYSQLKAIEALTLSLHLVFVFLLRHGLVRRPPRQYNHDQLRYELRARPFLTLSVPEPISFSEYQEAAELPYLQDNDMLDRAGRQCALARKAWEETLKTGQVSPRFPSAGAITAEWTKDVKDTIRACIAINIAISKLKKASDQPSLVTKTEALGTLTVSLPAWGESGRWHRWWIVPKID